MSCYVETWYFEHTNSIIDETDYQYKKKKLKRIGVITINVKLLNQKKVLLLQQLALLIHTIEGNLT